MTFPQRFVTLTNGLSTIDGPTLVQMSADVANALDGNAGGAYAPSAPIIIGGQGIDPTLRPTKWPNFAADASGIRTFTRRQTCMPFAQLPSGGSAVGFGFVQGLANGIVVATELCVPHNATLTSIVARVKIKNTHAGLPVKGPGLSVFRIDTGNVASAGSVTLNNTDLGDEQEITLAVPGTVGAYNALGDTSWTYTCNQNNVVDKSHYLYVAVIADEQGPNAIMGNIFTGFDFTFTLTDLEVA